MGQKSDLIFPLFFFSPFFQSDLTWPLYGTDFIGFFLSDALMELCSQVSSSRKSRTQRSIMGFSPNLRP